MNDNESNEGQEKSKLESIINHDYLFAFEKVQKQLSAANIYEEIKKQFSAADIYEEVQKQFSATNAFEELQRQFKATVSEIESFANQFGQIAKNISESVSKSFSGLQSVIEETNERCRHYGFSDFDGLLNGFIGISCHAGYIPDDDMDMNKVWELIEIWFSANEEDKKKVVTEFWSIHYEEKLRHIIDEQDYDWFPVERVHILKESVSAYQNGLYYVAMPVIYSLIEGLIGTARKQRIYDSDIVGPVSKSIGFTSQEDIKEIIREKFYDGFYFSEMTEEKKYSFSRHAILHGGSLFYGTKDNYHSLFSILLASVDIYKKMLHDSTK